MATSGGRVPSADPVVVFTSDPPLVTAMRASACEEVRRYHSGRLVLIVEASGQ